MKLIISSIGFVKLIISSIGFVIAVLFSFIEFVLVALAVIVGVTYVLIEALKMLISGISFAVDNMEMAPWIELPLGIAQGLFLAFLFCYICYWTIRGWG